MIQRIMFSGPEDCGSQLDGDKPVEEVIWCAQRPHGAR